MASVKEGVEESYSQEEGEDLCKTNDVGEHDVKIEAGEEGVKEDDRYREGEVEKVEENVKREEQEKGDAKEEDGEGRGKEKVKTDKRREKKGKEKSRKSAKKEPSRVELHTVVEDILKEVDFNTATFSYILRLLGKQFGIDLIHRKLEVKEIITEVMNNMSDDEDEKATESGDGDDFG
ncbi:protein DEK [Dorcoceras hygrometricum]|uniref:Protein DEK n=1 Tax=Dorcoceras hygrometricum TaxID=472368 RepID=A0A2Z7B4C4_9LAMI|nr:protein DEK [Dorcoceras hygrometricum]